MMTGGHLPDVAAPLVAKFSRFQQVAIEAWDYGVYASLGSLCVKFASRDTECQQPRLILRQTLSFG
jgi:hypothetical protein